MAGPNEQTLSNADSRYLTGTQQDIVREAKAEYDAAKARGDTAGMTAAHAKAQNERIQSGYQGDVAGNYVSADDARAAQGTGAGQPSTPSPNPGGNAGRSRSGGSSAPGAYTIGTVQGGINYNDALSNPGKRVDMTDGAYLEADANGVVWAHTADGRVLRAQTSGQGGNVVDIGRIGHINTDPLEARLAEERRVAEERARAQADYAVQQGVNELQRAQEDAAPKYQAMRDQIDIDEARAKDNQALYAEARGDRGGIGAAQYDSIMNTAAQNRVRVNQEQTKLATDTARAIADLRAQGEFQKADAILQLAQNYLSQLNQLEQWALSTNLSIDQFNIGVDQWLENFQMQAANITGEYKGMPTMAAKEFDYRKGIDERNFDYQVQQDYQKQQAGLAEAMLTQGFEPTEAMYKALGFSDAQIANGTAQRFAGSVIAKQKQTEAQNKVATMLKSGAMLSEIPKEELTKAGFEDWEIKAMMQQPAQQRALADLAMGMTLEEIGEEILAATGWTDTEKKYYHKSAQAALQAAAQKAARGSGGSRKTADDASGDGVDWSALDDVYAKYQNDDAAMDAYLENHFDELGFKNASRAKSAWHNHQYDLEYGVTDGTTKLSSADALLTAKANGSTVAEQINVLRRLYADGQITKDQEIDLEYALQNPSK